MVAKRTAAIVGGCALALSVPAGAHAASDQTITTLGSSQVKVTVKRSNRHSNAAIKRAVDRSYARAIPAAIDEAREDALLVAQASGLTLGPIQSVDESVTFPFPYYGPRFDLSPFGPGQYCGKVSRRFHVRDKQGRLHTRTRMRRVCHVPEFATSTLTVTFAATPAT